MSTLSFDHVSVRFGRGARTVEAVRDVSFTVPSGRIVGLVGESGSGKSTLARAAVGLHEPSSGTITLDGVDVANARGSVARRRQTIQMVFQDPNSCLDPQMTVGESIAEALVIAARRQHREASAAGPTTKASRRDRTAELLTKVNLHPDHAHVRPNKLSGGQRQRVAIARALAAEPHVLLADEITSALDVSVQGSVLNVLLDLHAELGLTILFISHNLAVVRQLCDDVVVLNQGELVEQGPVLDVLDNPSQDYTRELLGAIPRLGQPLFPERSPRDDSPAAR